MSRRTAESNKAILAAWNKEQELVREGKGTREWTLQQQQDILDRGKAYDDDGVAFQGQHMKSAEMYPEYQGDTQNIQFLTREEHLEAHDGNWRNPTNWYYNPVTKEKKDFGDGPVIPCKIIQLSESIIKPQIEIKESQPIIQECISEIQLKEQQNTKHEEKTQKVSSKQNNAVNISMPGFGHKFKQGLKMIGNTIVEFPEKHPMAMKVIKGIGIVTATITAAVVVESSKRGTSDSEYGKTDTNDNVGSNKDDAGNLYEDYLQDEDSSETTYTPNDVPAGRQRYHYKDGSVKWKDKPSYHRGGRKNE